MSEALSENSQKVLDLIEKLSILELSQLVKTLQDKYDITPISVAAAPITASAADAAPVEEKSSYNLVLQSAGEKKIAVIKAVRGVNQSLGLKEAKELVEGAPKTVAEGLSPEEAEQAKAALEEAGATVEFQ